MKLKLILKNKDIILEPIEEFTVGKQFFYARYRDGGTTSIPRYLIRLAFRKTKEGEYKTKPVIFQLHLKLLRDLK